MFDVSRLCSYYNKKDGQPDAVEDGVSGFLFKTLEELGSHTVELPNNDALWRGISEASIKVNKDFTLDKSDSGKRETFNLPWSCIGLRPEHKDHVRRYDFMVSRTSDGRAFKLLTTLDEYTG